MGDVANLEDASRRDEEKREAALVAAADEGVRSYYAAAGFAKPLGILAATAIVAVIAQQRIHHLDYLFGSLGWFVALFILSTITGVTPWGTRSRARGEARSLRRTAANLLKKHQARVGSAGVAEVEKAIAAVDAALKLPQALPSVQARTSLDEAVEKHLSFGRKSAAREYTEQIGGAILVALILRTFVFEPFHIPSGSMIPTLLVGDFIFVNKMSYGVRIPFTNPATVHKIAEGMPARGDVIVFMVPKHPEIDYVKRVIGLPGDRIEVDDNELKVNGVVQSHAALGDYTYLDHSEYTDADSEVTVREFDEKLGDREHKIVTRKESVFSRNGSWTVEPGRVFVMGDNRDNSQDSRVEGGPGQIPFSYIKGRASVIWISFGGEHGIRFSRMFHSVK